jgi:hypothetical protein
VDFEAENDAHQANLVAMTYVTKIVFWIGVVCAILILVVKTIYVLLYVT